MYIAGNRSDLAGKGGLTRTVWNEAYKRLGAKSLTKVVFGYLGRKENADICREIEQLSIQIYSEKDPKVRQMLTNGLDSIFKTLEQKVGNKERVEKAVFARLKIA